MKTNLEIHFLFTSKRKFLLVVIHNLYSTFLKTFFNTAVSLYVVANAKETESEIFYKKVGAATVNLTLLDLINNNLLVPIFVLKLILLLKIVIEMAMTVSSRQIIFSGLHLQFV